ncbi:MAG: hypothetical protein R3288_14595 [Woeseiaceae bacterium]|nr:hypothetical protein [Woeseiaceae bacterium]
MSASRRGNALASGLLLLGSALALAADEDVPDMAFLEYLGMWQESDEEWLAFEDETDSVATDSDKRIDPVPDGEESKEYDDES